MVTNSHSTSVDDKYLFIFRPDIFSIDKPGKPLRTFPRLLQIERMRYNEFSVVLTKITDDVKGVHGVIAIPSKGSGDEGGVCCLFTSLPGISYCIAGSSHGIVLIHVRFILESTLNAFVCQLSLYNGRSLCLYGG